MPNEPNLPRFKRLTTEAQRSQRRSSIQGKDRSDLIAPWPRCLRGGDSRQTKPNLGRMGYLGGSSGRHIVSNEANLAQRTWHPQANYAERTQSGQAGGRAGALAVEMRQTNPICGGSRGSPQRHRDRRDGPRFKAKTGLISFLRGLGVSVVEIRAKQSQTWEEWGIWVDARGAYCAKRSQSRAARLPSGGELRQTNPVWPSRWAVRSLGGRNAPNEANFRATPNYRLTLFWRICTFACFPNVGKVRPCCDCRFGTAPAPFHSRWSAILRVRSLIPVATAVAK
jgi:hypothetical protein